MKYADRPSSPEAGAPRFPSHAEDFRRSFFSGFPLVLLPLSAVARARHGYALSRQGREKLPKDPRPLFLRLFLAFARPNFRFAPRTPDFRTKRASERAPFFSIDTIEISDALGNIQDVAFYIRQKTQLTFFHIYRVYQQRCFFYIFFFTSVCRTKLISR